MQRNGEKLKRKEALLPVWVYCNSGGLFHSPLGSQRGSSVQEGGKGVAQEPKLAARVFVSCSMDLESHFSQRVSSLLHVEHRGMTPGAVQPAFLRG